MRLWILATMIGCGSAYFSVSAQEAYDVCRAIKVKDGKQVFVRGIGEFGPDGLVLGDATCPNIEVADLELPAMVLIDVKSFASATVRNRYESVRNSGNPLQLLARGDLICAVPLRLKLDASGDITEANGYGADRVINCRLSNAMIIRIHEIQNRRVERQLLK